MTNWRNEVTCPECDQSFYATFMQVVDFAEDPQLRQRLINREVNYFVCPNCGAEMSTDFFLVRDPGAPRIVFFIANGKDDPVINQLLRNLLSIAFDGTKPYYKNPVSVDTWEELTDLIREPS